MMRSRHHRRSAVAGFTLIEALAATSLLGVGLLGLATHSVNLTRTAKHADSVSAASGLAVQKLEQLRSMPLGASGPYRRSWSVSAKNQPGFGLKTVTVTIGWKDSQSHTTKVAAYVRCSTVPCT